jgi:hypothetical protein
MVITLFNIIMEDSMDNQVKSLEKTFDLNEASIDLIKKWSGGNPGALSFLLNAQQKKSKLIFSVLEKATSIRGVNIWTLYSDLCQKDISKVENLCRHCPIEILEDACSRQDYSGRELVKGYFDGK